MSPSFTKYFPLISDQGKIPAQLGAELFVYAQRKCFTGSLLVRSGKGEQFVIRFVEGAPSRVFTKKLPSYLASSLAEVLPPEQLAFALQHAGVERVEDLSTVEGFNLLPQQSLEQVHRETVLQVAQSICGARATLLYQFLDGEDWFAQRSGYDKATHPVWVILQTLANVSECQGWLKKRLQPLEDTPMKLADLKLAERLLLRGKMRQVVVGLQRRSESLQTLRLSRALPEPQVAALVYTLCATGELVPLAAPRDASARPVSRRAPTVSGICTQSAPPFLIDLPPAQASAPSRSRAVTQAAPVSRGPRSQPVSATRGRDERSVESSALRAWMRTVAEPEALPRTLPLIERAAAQYPNNPRILFYVGCLYAMSQRVEEAEDNLLKVLRLDPEHTEASRELAALKQRSGQRVVANSSFFGRLSFKSGS